MRDMARARNRGQAIPGWGMLLIGLVIGLFIAFLVYLDRLDTATVAKKQTEAPEPAVKPRFEFYSILPELEIVVPDILENVVPDRSSPQSTGNADSGPTYYLQAGSFKNGGEADRMKAHLALLGLDVVVQSVTVNKVEWHRVRVGPLHSAQALRRARERLRENDIEFMLLKTGG
jgi:cell division protein FtsN